MDYGVGRHDYQGDSSQPLHSAFPTIGVIGAPPVTSMISSTASTLGIKVIELPAEPTTLISHHEGVDHCSLIWCQEGALTESAITTLEAAGLHIFPSPQMFARRRALHLPGGPAQFSLMVARSAHNQAATWTVTELSYSSDILTGSITPPPNLSPRVLVKAQAMALESAASLSLIGVMSMRFDLVSDEILVRDIVFGPERDGLWTIEGARTSQVEQHIRAILDLPLGDTSHTAAHTVVEVFHKGVKPDMYRPYLHLMARTPLLKFYQYAHVHASGEVAGHLSISGDNLDYLRQEVLHAVAYISGEVDE